MLYLPIKGSILQFADHRDGRCLPNHCADIRFRFRIFPGGASEDPALGSRLLHAMSKPHHVNHCSNNPIPWYHGPALAWDVISAPRYTSSASVQGLRRWRQQEQRRKAAARGVGTFNKPPSNSAALVLHWRVHTRPQG